MEKQVKRILLIHSASDLYGASKVALETIEILVRNNFYVVVALSQEGSMSEEVRRLGYPLEIIPLATVRRKYLNIKGLQNRRLSLKRGLSEIDRICQEHSIDTIYSSTTAIIIGALYKRKNNINHLWHVLEITPGPKWLLKVYAFLLTRYTDLAFGVSDAVKNHWLSIDKKIPIKRLYNGFSFTPFAGENTLRSEIGVGKDDVLIGMVARVHFWKGQEYFLQIAECLKSYFNNLKFIMVGDAYPGYEYLYDEIKTSIAKKGLEHMVIDLGYREDVNRILDSLDIFVLPSTQPDPLPTTLLEAKGAGKPVVATNHGGAPEMLEDNVTGFLIPWNDPEKAAKIMLPLIKDKDLRTKMGGKGRERVNRVFSNTQHEVNLLELISSLEQ